MGMEEARFLTADEAEAWDDLVAASSGGSLFDETRWQNVVARGWHEEIRRVGIFEGGELVAGVAFAHKRRLLTPIAITPTLSYANSCHVLPTQRKGRSAAGARMQEANDALADFLMQQYGHVLITSHPKHVDLRSFCRRGWWTNVMYTYHVDATSLDLMALPCRRRNQIRYAEKYGVRVEEGLDLDLAHQLLAMTHERQGIPCPVSREQFAVMYEVMGDSVVQFSAWEPAESQPVAMTVVLHDKVREEAYVLLAGFDAEYAKTQASSLLYWRQLMALGERGIKMIDLVGAGIESNAAFKADFEGLLVPYYRVAYACLRYRAANWLMRRLR